MSWLWMTLLACQQDASAPKDREELPSEELTLEDGSYTVEDETAAWAVAVS